MKRFIILFITSAVLASCGGGEKKGNAAEELAKLKKDKAAIEQKIKQLEAKTPDTSRKITPVTTFDVQPTKFTSYLEVQSSVQGDENVLATSKANGVVNSVLVHPGQHVSRGQVLAILDADVMQQNIAALEPQITLAKSLYEKQQKLWAQNIGTEIQLLTARSNYEALTRQRASLMSQKNLYRIESPINGTVESVDIKVGDMAQPGGGGLQGIRVVSFDKLKAKADLGENYLGKVKAGDPVTLVFTDINDSIKTTLTYVGSAVNTLSRTFPVEIRLGNNNKLHPNMSCLMKIANYTQNNALVIPVGAIQRTAQGEVVYLAEGNVAKAVTITTGRNSNGLVEVLSGLNPGDKLITEGYQDLDNGSAIVTAQ